MSPEDRKAAARASKKRWAERNPDYQREYYRRNREKHRAAGLAWAEKNREAIHAKKSEWKRGNPDKARNTHLLRKFNITVGFWEDMFSRQDEKCAICLDQLQRGRNSHTDHDHATGKVRGILCFGCNSALGRFRDDPSIIARAAQYLSNPTADQVSRNQ